MKKLLIFLFFLAVISLFVLFYMFDSDLWPYSLDIPSPTQEYHLEQRYTGFLTSGYRGKTFLSYNDQQWLVDNIGPGYTGWLSDTEFFVGERQAEKPDRYRVYSVFDFILS